MNTKHKKKHKEALEKQLDVKRMLTKGNVYQQALRRTAITKVKQRNQNRSVIKKLLKPAYFMTRKKWPVRENFESIIVLLQDLGDEEINNHLKEGSKHATYISVKSGDRCLNCLSSHFEKCLSSHP